MVNPTALLNPRYSDPKARRTDRTQRRMTNLKEISGWNYTKWLIKRRAEQIVTRMKYSTRRICKSALSSQTLTKGVVAELLHLPRKFPGKNHWKSRSSSSRETGLNQHHSEEDRTLSKSMSSPNPMRSKSLISKMRTTTTRVKKPYYLWT